MEIGHIIYSTFYLLTSGLLLVKLCADELRSDSWFTWYRSSRSTLQRAFNPCLTCQGRLGIDG